MSDTADTTEPYLMTGWEPETPVNDTIMRQLIETMASEAEFHAGLLGGRVSRSDDFLAADVGRPAAHLNSCVLLKPLDESRVADLMGQLEAFFGIGGPATGAVILFSAWPTPDLRPFGWRLMGHPPAHVRPAGGSQPPLPKGVEFRRVETERDLLDWEQGAIAGYPFDELANSAPGSLTHPRMLDDPRDHLFVACIDGRVAGVSSAFVENGLVLVPLVATLPFARGRGIGTALTWLATLADPACPAMLLSSDEGRPVYDKMGYLPVIRLTLWYRLRG